MKKSLLIFILLLAFQSVSAQLFTKERLKNIENFDQQMWTWGYYLGLNTYDFKFNYNENQDYNHDVQVEQKLGFNIGLIGDMRINDYMNLRLEPGVNFVKRNITFLDLPQEALIGPGNERDVTSTYIHIPLLMKFSTKRINNFKPFVEAGVSTSINLSSRQDDQNDNYDGQFRMKTNTYYWEIGFGIDLYLYYFKFTPSIRGVFAMSNELVQDNRPNSAYTGGIDKMMTRGVFLNFKFQ